MKPEEKEATVSPDEWLREALEPAILDDLLPGESPVSALAG